MNAVGSSIKIIGVKKNRNLLNIFINGRYVKSLTAQAAIEKAYTSYIAPECFPTAVMFLEMNPAVVDVNVHPAKLEVKFSDERAVFETVYYTVKSALEEHEYRPEMQLGAKRPMQNLMGAYVPIGADTKGEQLTMSSQHMRNEPKVSATPYITDRGSRTNTYKEEAPIRFGSGSAPAPKHEAGSTLTPRDSLELLQRYRSTKAEEPVYTAPKEIPTTVDVPPYKFVGEAFDCYVMIEYDGALLVIDKHAAHERVIFEDLKRTREADTRIASQMLMLPLTVLLSPDELAAADDFAEEIRSVGFEFAVNGKGCDISAIPEAISAEEAETLFIGMLDELVDGRGDPATTEAIRRERALYQVACKAAIKGGRVYDRAVLEWLIGKVLTIPDITVCPHGRPIAYKLTKNELDRQFERIK